VDLVHVETGLREVFDLLADNWRERDTSELQQAQLCRRSYSHSLPLTPVLVR
jgi:hypothetical protein